MLISGVRRVVSEIEKFAQEFQDQGVAPETAPSESPEPQLPSAPELPDIGPPLAPKAPNLYPGEVPGGYSEPRQKNGINFELPEFSDRMSEPDINNTLQLLKLLADAIKNGDNTTLSYAVTMLKKIFKKYKEKPLTEPYFSIYSFWNKLEGLKKFQSKSNIIDISGSELAKTLHMMKANPANSRVLEVETYDYFKEARSGRVLWSVDYNYYLTPGRRQTIKVGVVVRNLVPEVENYFVDLKGNKRPFDSVTFDLYSKGELV